MNQRSERRNDVRLPYYARLDLRAQRTFRSTEGRITLFGEVLNLLNRDNQAPAAGVIRPRSLEAVGFGRELMPRRSSAGILISF
jgi:hypothetical protein